MQVKNIGERGWFISGVMVAPGATEEVECTDADLNGIADLEIVKSKVGRPAKTEATE